MIVWPSRADNCSKTIRGMISAALPALSGTMARIGMASHSSAWLLVAVREIKCNREDQSYPYAHVVRSESRLQFEYMLK
jgi:hypothetical protein